VSAFLFYSGSVILRMWIRMSLPPRIPFHPVSDLLTAFRPILVDFFHSYQFLFFLSACKRAFLFSELRPIFFFWWSLVTILFPPPVAPSLPPQPFPPPLFIETVPLLPSSDSHCPPCWTPMTHPPPLKCSNDVFGPFPLLKFCSPRQLKCAIFGTQMIFLWTCPPTTHETIFS